jgi:homospermidine synthase
MITKKTIKLKKYSDVIEELVAHATITPGHLVELLSTGKIRAHGTASGNALPMFALEDELQGKSISDNYGANDKVQVWIPYRGDIVNAILKDGQNVVVGDFLESAGDGTLQKHVADSTGDYLVNQIVGVAVEALDMSGSAGEDPSPRIAVRII